MFCLKFYRLVLRSTTQSFVSECCVFVRMLPKRSSILYLSSNRSPQTIIHGLFSCVYGVDWLESLSDLPYLSLITQLAALVLSRVCRCVRYAGDVGWCKYSTDRRGNVLWGAGGGDGFPGLRWESRGLNVSKSVLLLQT